MFLWGVFIFCILYQKCQSKRQTLRLQLDTVQLRLVADCNALRSAAKIAPHCIIAYCTVLRSFILSCLVI